MIVNGQLLIQAEPILKMRKHATKTAGPGGTTFGLGEAGYDIRIKQEIHFHSGADGVRYISVKDPLDTKDRTCWYGEGRFALASAIEQFEMPNDLVGIVHDKSTWARRGLSVFNTVIEPGWNGFLTLELVYHGNDDLIIPAGSGIAQVVFHRTAVETAYSGKYQNQEDRPVAARES